MECLRFPLENDQIPCIPTASTGIYYPANQFPHGLRAGHCYFCMEALAPSWTTFPVEKRCWPARSGTDVIGGRSRVPSEKRLPEPDERVFFWDFWERCDPTPSTALRAWTASPAVTTPGITVKLLIRPGPPLGRVAECLTVLFGGAVDLGILVRRPFCASE